MKPKLGSIVKYTDIGKGAYYTLYGCWPPNDGVLGVVITHPSNENLCAVQGADLQTNFFVWRFSDGELNYHFKWLGKFDD